MEIIRQEFAEFLIDHKIIEFGNFTEQSSHKRPYFFDFSKLVNGALLMQTSHYFARHIQAQAWQPQVIFGPAYKGIPLAIAISLSLQKLYGSNVDFAFNRKEQTDTGDSSQFIAAKLRDKRVLIVDDEITSGMTVDASITRLQAQGAQVENYMVLLDRQEQAPAGAGSALTLAEERSGIAITPLITIKDVLSCMACRPDLQRQMESLQTYLDQYATLDCVVV